MSFSLQVEPEHYFRKGYLTKDRWINYWYQFHYIRECHPKNLLEIGVGNGFLTLVLEKIGIPVTTIDIDERLNPSIVGSVRNLPLPDASYDFIVCAEVLEHLPFTEAEEALRELYRVSSKWVLITVPHSGYVFSLIFKYPLLSWKYLSWKLPHFWKRHRFQGEHYWELGKRGWSRKRLEKAILAAGLVIRSSVIHTDDPAHVFYLCQK